MSEYDTLITKEGCPICSNDLFKDLIDFGKIPIDSISVNPSKKLEKIELGFEYCSECAFIHQKYPKQHDYIEDERTSDHLVPIYATKIVNYFKDKVKPEDLVIEIGCNDGAFLGEFSKLGFTNLLGIEPSLTCSKICESKGYKTENTYFNQEESLKISEKYGSAKIIVFRYVLEHILDPLKFLNSVKNLLSEDGHFFIEVPDAKDIIYNLKAYNLWEQHFNHFTEGHLEKLVDNADLKTNKISTDSLASTDALLLWGSKAGREEKRKEYSFKEDLSACKNFKKNWENFCENLLKKIQKSPKPIVGIGASHPQKNFLIFSKIGDYFSNLIDDDKNKTNKYVFMPKPVKIISTEELLKSNFKGTIVKTAFGYDGWMNKICNSVSKETKIIDPYKK